MKKIGGLYAQNGENLLLLLWLSLQGQYFVYIGLGGAAQDVLNNIIGVSEKGKNKAFLRSSYVFCLRQLMVFICSFASFLKNCINFSFTLL